MPAPQTIVAVTSAPWLPACLLRLIRRTYVHSGRRPKPDVGNLPVGQAHAPLPLPAGHTHMPPGQKIDRVSTGL